MPKVKLEVNKLEGAEVQFISLVERGANRIPFKIMKSDKEQSMGIDLGKMFRVSKQEKQVLQPEIAALIVPESEALPQIVEVLKGAGFNVEKQDKVDGNVIFTQVEKSEEGTVYQVSENLGVVLHNVDLGANLEGEKILSVVKSEGYFPNAQGVSQEVNEAVQAAMESDDKTQVEKLEKDLQDVQKYVLSVAKAIPASVVKAEKAIVEVKKNCGSGKPGHDKEMMDEEEKKKEMAKKEEEVALAKKAEEDLKAKQLAEKSDLLESIKGLIAPVASQVKEIASKQEDLAKSIDEKVSTAVSKAVKEVDSKMDIIQKSVKEKLGSTLLGGDHGMNQDTLIARRAQKGEGIPSQIDTAYMTRKYDAKSRTFKYDKLQ